MYKKYVDLLTDQNISFKEEVLLAPYSTFSIGGPAKVAVFPRTADDIVFCIDLADRIGLKHTVIGNASNVLFSDNGFFGVIIFTSACKNVETKDNMIFAECGASFTRLASFAAKNSLSGLEFAYGIPGSVGGAVYMNAGAYGGQVSDVLVSTTAYDASQRKIVSIDFEGHSFDYRTSIFSKKQELTVLGSCFKLLPGNKEEISAKMEELMSKRREKQPLEFPNAGSTFKRPEGLFAGKLIEDCGLKGYRIGGAEVSEKHAGFIINRGGATAKDVLLLIDHIKETVLNKFGVSLECEIKYVD